MKNLYLLLAALWLLSVRPALAQMPATTLAVLPPTAPLRAKLDNVFANIDKSQVPTGRLLEAAVPLAYLPNYDGTLRELARTRELLPGGQHVASQLSKTTVTKDIKI